MYQLEVRTFSKVTNVDLSHRNTMIGSVMYNESRTLCISPQFAAEQGLVRDRQFLA